jgi:cell division protein FtsI (penicillin-binding protein 3)
MTSSYGYGVSTTPLHFMRAVAAMVNDGVMVSPSLIKGNPSRMEQRVLSKKTSDEIKKLLYLSAQKGTGMRAKVDGYMVGGKTGSANKSVQGSYDKKNHLGTVSAVFPMNKPKYILIVTLDSPKGTKETFGFATGGWTAAPIASKIIKRTGPLLKVLPIDEKSEIIKKAMYVKVDYEDKKRAIG